MPDQPIPRPCLQNNQTKKQIDKNVNSEPIKKHPTAQQTLQLRRVHTFTWHSRKLKIEETLNK
jgi:hypothetical protein